MAYAGRRNIPQRREHPGSAAAEALLQGLPQILRNAVHLNLGIAVMHHAKRPFPPARPLHLAKERIKIAVVAARQVNPVRILIKKVVIEMQGVVLHAETVFNALQHRIHIHTRLAGIAQGVLKRRKAQRDRPGSNAIGRHHQPQHSQQGEHAQKKE